MCGIVGMLNLEHGPPVGEEIMRRMLAMIRHRGPDQFGIYLDAQIGLGSARLSIVDLHSGQQPIANEDETLWIVFNGEIFNHIELRPALEARGHRFATQCDTEVVLHMYEEYGPDCLHHFNGQFAFAIWDARDQSLFLARDRLGVRPIFYTQTGGTLVFGSEIKALLAGGQVQAAIDPLALDQVFTCWSVQAPRTVFRDIAELPAGHYLHVREGHVALRRYWQLDFQGDAAAASPLAEQEYLEQFRELLIDATRIRLRADVPVGSYLSGGLDSSTIASIVRRYATNRLDTFSIAFSDPDFDERAYQEKMARALGTNHHVVEASYTDIGRVFPEVVWHAETPLLRSAPAPMFLLSKLVQQQNFKVVLTGEGADEFLAGYDLFKEAKVRRFWAQQPRSLRRPLLFKRLYPWMPGLSEGNPGYLAAFFGIGLQDVDDPAYSHAVRWRTTGRTRRFFSAELQQAIAAAGDGAPMSYPDAFAAWDWLQRAQYVEVTSFLSPYLLSSQGDRMAMAHAVEGRFPFLDYRIVEFCSRLPARLKLRGLTEKYLLKQLGREWLPEDVWQRPKRPYRAPIHRCF